MIAGTLELQMFANIARLQNDMNEAKKTVKEASETIEKMLGLIGVGFGAKELIEKINSTIEAMANLKEQAEKTGVSIENLSKLKFAAEISGKNIDSVTNAMGLLAKGMAGTGKEAAAASQAFKYLGLTTVDENGHTKDLDTMYRQIAIALNKYSDGAGKNALARALMGKAGADQIPIMKQLIELGDMDAITTTEQAEASKKYLVDVHKLQAEKEKLWQTISTALLPSMETFVNVLLTASKNTDSLGNNVKGLAEDHSIETWADNAAISLAALIDVISTIGTALAAVGGSFKVTFQDLKILMEGMKLADPIQYGAKLVNKGPSHVYDDFNAAWSVGLDTEKKADAAWAALGSSNGTKYYDSMIAAIAARKAAKPVEEAGSPLKSADFNFTSADKAAKTYEAIIKEINQYQAVLDAEYSKQTKLTEADKLAAKAKAELTAAQLKQIKPKLDNIKADETMFELSQKLTKDDEARFAAGEKEVANIEAKVKARLEENEKIGLTTAQVDALNASNLQAQIISDQTLLNFYAENDIRGANVDLLKEELDALQRLQAAENAGSVKQANADAIKKQAEAWKQFTDQLETSLTDALIRGFEGGKNAGQNFIDTLKHTLETAALKIVIQALVSPVTGALQGVTGGSSTMSGGGIGGATNPFQQWTGSSIGYGIADAAQWLSSGSAMGPAAPGSLGSMFSGAGSVPNWQYGLAGLGGGLVGGMIGGSTGSTLGSVGATIGMAMGGPIGAIIGGVGGGLLGSLFGGGADPHNNAQVSGYNLGLNRSGAFNVGSSDNTGISSFVGGPTSGSGWWSDSSALSAAQIAAINQQVTATFASGAILAQALGVSSSVLNNVSVSSASNGVADAKLGGYFSSVDQAFAALSDKIATAILPNVADFKQGSETLGQTLTRVAGDIQGLDAISNHLGMTMLSNASIAQKAAAAEKLVAAAGGSQAFAANLQAFYQGFYSDTERQANAVADLRKEFNALGVQLPASTDQWDAFYRQLVTGIDVTTDSGATLFGQLLTYASAMDAATKSTTNATDAAQKLADAQHALYLGNLSPLTSQQQLGVASNDLQGVFSKAMGGDAAALAALPQSGQDFLTAARSFYASAPEYTAAFQQVQAMLEIAKSAGTMGGATSATVSIPGFATGLDRVPYDNFLMFAHQGESVLTASQADDWRSGRGGITSADLSGIEARLDRLTAVVMAGDRANVEATNEVATTHSNIAFREQTRAKIK